jgi:hypothetical protein
MLLKLSTVSFLLVSGIVGQTITSWYSRCPYTDPTAHQNQGCSDFDFFWPGGLYSETSSLAQMTCSNGFSNGASNFTSASGCQSFYALESLQTRRQPAWVSPPTDMPIILPALKSYMVGTLFGVMAFVLYGNLRSTRASFIS